MATQKPRFKLYNQSQLSLLPPSLDDLVPDNHPARIVNDIINQIDIHPLILTYKPIGTTSYHPIMMLKLIVYGYVSNVYSSRKLETACKENVAFMWLTGMSYPDHNTINRFRSERLKTSLRKIFDQIVLLLSEQGLLSIEEVYIDGTKIEANANKYTFVWKKSIQTNKEKMKNQLTAIWKYAQEVASDDDDLPDPPDFTSIDKEQVQATVDTLNKVLKNKPEVPKKTRAKLKYISTNYPLNMEKYEQQENILGERNSYSKTDPEATFMRMKEDPMKNGQLKAGYNVQISTSNQFIVNYSIHPNPTDTTTLASHLEAYQESYQKTPSIIVADAGYGSHENYHIADQNQIEAYIKYNVFDKERKRTRIDKNPFSAKKLFFNKEENYLVCPMGQHMEFIGKRTQVTATGFKQTVDRYQAKNCKGCPLRVSCHKSKQNRIIEVNAELERYKSKARELLSSEKGIKKRKQRCHDVEAVFGNIKRNHGFRRFMLRGKEKVAIEWGLLAIAQNIRKKAV